MINRIPKISREQTLSYLLEQGVPLEFAEKEADIIFNYCLEIIPKIYKLIKFKKGTLEQKEFAKQILMFMCVQEQLLELYEPRMKRGDKYKHIPFDFKEFLNSQSRDAAIVIRENLHSYNRKVDHFDTAQRNVCKYVKSIYEEGKK